MGWFDDVVNTVTQATTAVVTGGASLVGGSNSAGAKVGAAAASAANTAVTKPGQFVAGAQMAAFGGVGVPFLGAQPGVVATLARGGNLGQNLAGYLHGTSTELESGILSNSDRNNSFQLGVKGASIAAVGAGIGALSGSGAAADAGGGAVDVSTAEDYGTAEAMNASDAAVTSESLDEAGYIDSGIGVSSASTAGAAAGASSGAGATGGGFLSSLGTAAETAGIAAGTGALISSITGKSINPGEPGSSGGANVSISPAAPSDPLASIFPSLFGNPTQARAGGGIFSQSSGALPILVIGGGALAYVYFKKRKAA